MYQKKSNCRHMMGFVCTVISLSIASGSLRRCECVYFLFIWKVGYLGTLLLFFFIDSPTLFELTAYLLGQVYITIYI